MADYFDIELHIRAKDASKKKDIEELSNLLMSAGNRDAFFNVNESNEENCYSSTVEEVKYFDLLNFFRTLEGSKYRKSVLDLYLIIRPNDQELPEFWYFSDVYEEELGSGERYVPTDEKLDELNEEVGFDEDDWDTVYQRNDNFIELCLEIYRNHEVPDGLETY